MPIPFFAPGHRRAQGSGRGRHGGRPPQGHLRPSPQHLDEAHGHLVAGVRGILPVDQRRPRPLQRGGALGAERVSAHDGDEVDEDWRYGRFRGPQAKERKASAF